LFGASSVVLSLLLRSEMLPLVGHGSGAKELLEPRVSFNIYRKGTMDTVTYPACADTELASLWASSVPTEPA